MSVQPPNPVISGARAPLESPAENVRSRTGLVRYSIALAIAGLGWIIPFTGASGVLLPARIAEIDPENKVGIVAAVVAAGALTAMVAAVVFGNLSDQTRSRLGRRGPWIIVGAITAATAMFLLSRADSVPMLILWWAVYQAAQNSIAAVLIASIPDRVPRARRGTVSAVYGGSQLFGGTVGSIVGAAFIPNPTTGFLVLATIVLVLPLAFPLLAPDYSNREQERRRSSLSEIVKSFAFPKNAPDFYFALASRLVILLGFNAVAGYQLYILTDYVQLSPTDAGGVITQASLITLVAAFVGSFVFGPLSDRLKRRKVIVMLGAVLMACGILILLVAAAPWAFLVFAGLAGIGMGIFLSVDAALLSEVLPNDETRGKDLGILNLSGSAGQVLAPAVSAAIIGIGIGFAPVFIIGAILSLAGAALIAPIKMVR